jgi:signal transduction histidine kinase
MEGKVSKLIKYLKGLMKLGNGTTNEIRIITIYRYCSLFLTSFVYLTGPPKATLIFKIGVIVSLAVASKIVLDLSIQQKDNINAIKTLVIIELLGITVLLIPTGDMHSPFIWYALNPVLLAASFLPIYFCWISLFSYLTTSVLISLLLFNKQLSMAELLYGNYRIIAIFILITLMVQLMSDLTKKLYKQSQLLQEKNKKLQELNSVTLESVDHIMTLYQIVEALSDIKDRDTIIETFAEYTAKLTKADFAFLWIINYKVSEDYIALVGEHSQQYKIDLLNEIENKWESMRESQSFFSLDCNNKSFLCITVKSNTGSWGIVGVRADNLKKDAELHGKQLTFISEICGIVLDRFNFEDSANKLMIAEEQNRIASEIHDNVSQQLFGISCGIHSLLAHWSNISKEDMSNQLKLIADSSNSAMHELRSAIYRLSLKNNGEKTFSSTVDKYLQNLAKLNNIDIKFEFIGEETLVSFTLKRALYRIISEAVGNAIRHGKSSFIVAALKIENSLACITIVDNGIGFNTDGIKEINKLGLGVKNMQNIALSYGGKFNISSVLNKGTVININIPITNRFTSEEAQIAL